MPNLSSRKPLTDTEKKFLYLAVKEMKSRGKDIPVKVSNLFENKKKAKWPVDERGYFVKFDGKSYEPSENHDRFINSTARFVALFGPRGCIDANTIVGGVPIGDRTSFYDKIPTMFGDVFSPPSYKNGRDNLYWVTTQFGSRVSVTEHHRFLTPLGWQSLNQLSIGSLILSDGTLRAKNQRGKSLDYSDYCSSDFHLCDELHNLLEEVSLSILQQLHKPDADIYTQLPHDRLSIAGSLGLLLFQLFLEYSIGLISSLQLSEIFQIVQRFLSRQDRPNTFLQQNWEDEFYEDYYYLFQPHVLTACSILGDQISADKTHRSDDIFVLLHQDIVQTLYQRGIHFQFQVPVELFGLSKDSFSLSESQSLYYKLLRLYKLGQQKYSSRAQSVLLSSLPEFLSILQDNLYFSVFPSLDFLSNEYDNSNTVFDEIQDISFDKFGDFYDISIPNANSYIADGLIHHNCGKSGGGAQKMLRKIRDGESGAVMNPDMENFKLSTWPELKSWLPWDMVVPSQRGRQRPEWEPTKPFTMVFTNGAKVYCKGLKDPDSARGPNINWLWYDEAGRDKTGQGWKIAISSVRVGANPQAWATFTPKTSEHWTTKFFVNQEIPEDVRKMFAEALGDDKILIECFHATREDNKKHLDAGFYASILAANPSGWLKSQEFDGEVADEGGQIGYRSWFADRVITTLPTKIIKRIRAWDTAGSEKKVAKDDPDESVGSLLSKFIPLENPDWLAIYGHLLKEGQEKQNHFILENQVAGLWIWERLLEVIKNTGKHDGPYVPIYIDQDPGGAGKNQVAAVASAFKDERNPELNSHQVLEVDVRKVGDRVLAANNHWFGVAAEGRMWLMKGSWNEKFLGQLDGFTMVAHDDLITSVTSGMFTLNPYKKFARMPFVTI